MPRFWCDLEDWYPDHVRVTPLSGQSQALLPRLQPQDPLSTSLPLIEVLGEMLFVSPLGHFLVRGKVRSTQRTDTGAVVCVDYINVQPRTP
jgi:hypothetical protein